MVADVETFLSDKTLDNYGRIADYNTSWKRRDRKDLRDDITVRCSKAVIAGVLDHYTVMMETPSYYKQCIDASSNVQIYFTI